MEGVLKFGFGNWTDIILEFLPNWVCDYALPPTIPSFIDSYRKKKLRPMSQDALELIERCAVLLGCDSIEKMNGLYSRGSKLDSKQFQKEREKNSKIDQAAEAAAAATTTTTNQHPRVTFEEPPAKK